MKEFTCIKTGCHMWSDELRCYFLGDLYFTGDPLTEPGIYILKAVCRLDTPMRDRLHIDVKEMAVINVSEYYVCIITDINWYDYDGVICTGKPPA